MAHNDNGTTGRLERARMRVSRALEFFTPLKDCWTVIMLCRFSVISVLTGIAFLMMVPQGVDVLLKLSTAGVLAKVTFAVAAALWTLSIWYYSRAILGVKYPDWPPAARASDPRRKRVIDGMQRHFPRMLGLLAIGSVALALLLADRKLGDAKGDLTGLFWVTLALTFAFVAFVVLRRRFVLGNTVDEPTERPHPTTRKVIVATCVIAVAVGVVFSVRQWVHAISPSLGAATIVLLAAAVWVPLGSVAIYVGARYRAPVLLIVVLWLLFCAMFNNNHEVRVVANPIEPRDSPLPAVVGGIPKAPDGKTYAILVAADGGGIRAAYWTATALAALEDRYPGFAAHVLVVSGVSGGSVGAGVFASLIAQRNESAGKLECRGVPGDTQTPMLSCARKILGQDFLAAPLATMLFPDFFQRFVPASIPYFDRGRTLEESWENAWRDVIVDAGKKNRLSDQFEKVWAASPGDARVPSLVLNATHVESGRRLYASDLALDALDAVKLNTRLLSMSLSTAMHNSARFTYVSPAGKLPRAGLPEALGKDGAAQVVDGGYFENTGTTMLLDIVRTMAGEAATSNVVPIVIRLKNAPKGEGETPKALRITSEIWAPVQTLAATREARGGYAVEAIRKAVAPGHYVELAPAVDGESVQLPLGWALSEPARREMDRQVHKLVCDAGSPLANALKNVVAAREGSCGVPQSVSGSR